MKLEEHSHNSKDKTFIWKSGNRVVASITLYPDGLVDFLVYKKDRNTAVAIERIGRKDMQLVLDQLEIKL